MRFEFNKERLEKIITFLACGVFLLSSVTSFNQIFMVLMFALLLTYWAFAHQMGSIPKQIKFIIYAFFAFFLTTIPNMLLNDSLSYGLKIFNQPLGYVLAAIVLLLMVGLRVHLNQKMIFYAIGVACFVDGVIAIYQGIVLGMDRVDGFIGISEFGNVGAVLALCAFAYFCISLSWKEKIFFAVATIFACFVMIFSGTRGVMIGFGAGFALIVGLFVYFEKQRRMRVLRHSMYFLLALCITIMSIPQAKDSIVNRFKFAITDINQYEKKDYNAIEDLSLGQRFEMWKEAIVIIKLSPIIGLSPKSICDRKYEINALAKSLRNPDELNCYGRYHSEILNTLARKGFLGLLALLAVWASLASFFWRGILQCGVVSLSMLGILLYYIVGGATGEPMSAFSEGNYFLMVVIIFASLVFSKKETSGV
ncbi:O-antigen ligase family protein [Helicobacter sp. 11S02596-1]|uniref:O-antigen ligase family protein n=1 Tax=Helicobacter sp. 11S02596-1 TaxID=1476194 RepID=UPI000BA61A0C|nr:O-antigen ligase family protein [Helicobacter sp. 11S02596-1]PAF43941.1 hypothetical protein BJI48_03900 [Helicobacter sp. 11S02596-1]